MTRRRVLVTGAGGFVGRALVRGFADLDWRVVGVDRAFDAPAERDGIRRLTAELAQGVPGEVAEVDLVVHAAWVTTSPETLGISAAEHAALNLRPLLAVLEHAARARPGAFVFLSSSGVFSPGDATDGLTDGDHPTGTSPYAAAKRAGELLVSALPSARRGDRAAAVPRAARTAVHVVRLGYLYGPDEVSRPSRQEVSLVAGWVAAARSGRPLAVRSDDPARDWTFTPDLAPALERLVDGPPAGRPVHLGSPHVRRDSALAQLIAAEIPGAETVTVPAAERAKPPMIPSDIPSLRDFAWTDPRSGVRALLAGAAA